MRRDRGGEGGWRDGGGRREMREGGGDREMGRWRRMAILQCSVVSLQ